MLIIDGSLFFTLLFFAIPVLVFRDIIRAIRKSIQHRRTKRLIQELEALLAQEEEDKKRREEDEKRWQEEREERHRQLHEKMQRKDARIHELEAAVEAASDPDERKAAEERLFIELTTPL